MHQQQWFSFPLPSETKLTGGRKAEVFLFPTGGVVELEDVQDGLRVLFLLRFADVGCLKEARPLLRHALHTGEEYRMTVRHVGLPFTHAPRPSSF